ncbi:MAG TPA: Gfo/Idh/MocA family oxidoreductase, partial [Chloroflexota bacterium]|nr:Gfo/Idh/MocA family oxidoreductase [Chloroflexota bacterium]
VSIALPPADAELAVSAALAAGVPVLAEKPLAASEGAAQRLAQAAQGVANGVDFQFAELETFSALRDLIASGELGAVRQVTVFWLTESYAQRHGQWSWKTDADAGGGVMSLLGSHALYLVEWLVGPVATLSAVLDRTTTRGFAPDGANPAPDTAYLILRASTGLPVGMSVSNAAPGEAQHRWEIVFDRGRARAVNVGADYMAGFRLDVAHHGEDWMTILQEPRTQSDGRLPPFIRLAGRFTRAVRRGERMRPDFADGARVQRLLAAAEESDDTGRSVSVAPAY